MARPPLQDDERSRVAGHTAMLVPMVIVICAGTVTCFVSASRSDNLTVVVLTVWAVVGVVSLAAITGGVALIGRLAQAAIRRNCRGRGQSSGCVALEHFTIAC